MPSKTLFALSLLALTRNACSIEFPAPQPTTVLQDDPAKDLQGWTPKPTESPEWVPRGSNELVKRLTTSAGTRTCGWVYDQGSGGSSALTCAVGTCMLYTSGTLGMAGCCDGTDYSSCGWANKCYDYADIQASKCDSNCQAEGLNKLCTASASPYCQSWTYPGNGIKDYGCGTRSASTWATVSSAIAETYTAVADLPYAPQSALATGPAEAQTASGYATDKSTASGMTTERMSLLTQRSPDDGDDDDFNDFNNFDSSTTVTTISIVPLIVVVVIIVIGWLGALGIIIYCCRRSKKLTAKWDQPGGFNYRGPAPVGAAANVSQFGPPQQQQQPMTGAAAGYVNQGQVAPPQGFYSDDATKGIPQQTPQGYPVAANVSPMTAPISPAPAYQGQQQFQAPGGYPMLPQTPQTQIISPIQDQAQMAGFSPQQNYAYPQQGQQGYAMPLPQQAPPPQQQQQRQQQQQQQQTVGPIFELN